MINERLALQTHLLGVVTSSEVDWENSDFNWNDLTTPYYRVHLMRGRPSNLAMDSMDSKANRNISNNVIFSNRQGYDTT